MMKKLVSLFAGVVAFALTGCFEHHAVITLKKDGSGTITEETVFGEQAVAMMDQMAALGGEGDNPITQMKDREAADKRAAEFGEGVVVEKIEEINEGGRRGARVIYTFGDINKISYGFGTGVSEMGAGMTPEAAEAEEAPKATFQYADGKLTVTQPDPMAGDDAPEPAEVEEIDEASLMMAQQMMGDMRLSMRLDFPGGITETNASHVEGGTVTLVDMKMAALLKDPEKFKEFAQAKPETPAEMRELTKGVEGIKIETLEEIEVELK